MPSGNLIVLPEGGSTSLSPPPTSHTHTHNTHLQFATGRNKIFALKSSWQGDY